MARLNTKTTTPRVGRSPVRATGVETRTHEGGQGFRREAKGELFLLAVGRFHGEDSFYESAEAGTRRFRELVREVTRQDPAWVRAFLRWLRGPEANIRTGAIVGAAEYVRARLEAGEHGDNREVVASVLQRLDEPGELLAYWLREYGRAIPKPIKRGVGDAVITLMSEYGYAKYDSSSRALGLADVLALTHPGDKAGSRQVLRGEWQSELFELVTSSPYRDVEPGESLTMLRARQELMAVPVTDRRAIVLDEPERLAAAGVTWEALAGWLQGPMDARAWEAVIPQMGVMALIRNLRNFDQAGISKETVAKVIAKISDPEVVARSRQLPFRWLAAYRAVDSDRYRVALGEALDHSTANIPDLPGRTLILVDVSSSMGATMSGKSQMAMVDAAGLFGSALAARLGDRADLVAFGTGSEPYRLPRGGSVLRHAEGMRRCSSRVGHGTNTWDAVDRHFAGHDRVMVFTDGQTRGQGSAKYRGTRFYVWNLAGYQASMVPSGEGNFVEVGGLGDSTFKIIPVIEKGQAASWPWEA